MRREAGTAAIGAVIAVSLAAGLLVVLALRPAEPGPVPPIDIPTGRSEELDRPGRRSPVGAAPVSPLPPPPASDDSGGSEDDGGGASDDGAGSGDDGRNEDDGAGSGGDDDAGAGDDRGRDDRGGGGDGDDPGDD